MIKVLIVDDSATSRKVLSETLKESKEITVTTTYSGKSALERIPTIMPDLITMDVEMPEMDGIQTLVKVKQNYPSIPVLMVSKHTEEGADKTIEALAKGASDFIAKPKDLHYGENLQQFKSELITKILELASNKIDDAYTKEKVEKKLPLPPKEIKVILIASSTGGPNALMEIFPKFVANLPVPILLVQHMPPMFTKHLSNRLNNASKIEVKEAENNDLVEAGKAYLAPGDNHLGIIEGKDKIYIKLDNKSPHENSCRPAADYLFRSAVKIYGDKILAVVMTGMGQDGLLGARLIKENNGIVIAQDKETSLVWGMPGVIVKAGLADKIIPLSQIPFEIMKTVLRSK